MTPTSRRGVLAATCLLVSLATAACSGSVDEDPPPAEGRSGTLVAAWETGPENWAPGSDNNDGIMRVPYETLIQRDPADPKQFIPMLATSWKQTDSAMTLELRDDVVFHDGTPFDAEAVKANIDYVMDGDGPFAGYFSAVDGVEVMDQYTVRINLTTPDPALETTLVSRAGFMGSPTALADGSISDAPVGTGPWVYDESGSTPGTRWVFGPFADYYEPDAVSLDRIELVAMSDPAARFAALRTGEIDVTDFPPSQVEQAEKAGLETVSVPGTSIAVFMVDRGPGGVLEDLETRQGVCSALDPDTFALVGGEGYRTMKSQRYLDTEYGYNPDVTGWTLDEDVAAQAAGISLDIGVFDGVAENAEALAGQLEAQGIDLQVDIVPAARYFADWYSKWSIGMGDNTEPHPFQWYSTWFAADAPNNASGVESPELKAAADAAIAAGSKPEAEALWQEVIKIINDEALVCLHQDFNFVAAWNPKTVDNVHVVPYMISWVDYRQITAVD